jgi:2',3'-cyclic-nucleotide 2'-phosphodiesterase (5'-nucleotidase family)
MEGSEREPGNKKPLTILHTNDLHDKLTAAQASSLRRLHDSLMPAVLLLDAGDAVGAGNITFRPGGEPILDRMSDAGYDAMAPGNREFHFSRPGFQAKVSRARFPVLCANVRPAGASPAAAAAEDEPVDGLPQAVRPWTLLTPAPGWRVVLFGLTVPMITERMLSRRISSYVFDDPIETAARLAPALRERLDPDLVVAVTHIGIKQDRRLAAEVGGIDLIVGGHTHVILEEGERAGGCLIAQAGSHARFVGRVEARAVPGERPYLTASLAPL